MSRSYRLSIRDSLRRVIRSEDSISTRLELIGIVSPEETQQLLAAALKEKGFEQTEDGALSRRDDKVTISVDPSTGEVTLRTSEKKDVHLVRDGFVLVETDASEKRTKEVLESGRKALREELEQTAARLENQLKADAADRLEAALGDIRKELDQAVNKVTIEALKLKAQRMGKIKELSENVEAGSLTIVVEV